jgi:hypothetical protein
LVRPGGWTGSAVYNERGLDASLAAVLLVVVDLHDLGGLAVGKLDRLAALDSRRVVGDGSDFAARGVEESVAEADRHGATVAVAEGATPVKVAGATPSVLAGCGSRNQRSEVSEGPGGEPNA